MVIFTDTECGAILRFAVSFNRLYGDPNFRNEHPVRGVPPLDTDINELGRSLMGDVDRLNAFLRVVAPLVNEGPSYNLVCAIPREGVAEDLGLPETTTLVIIYPKNGFTDTDVTIPQARERWMRTRLFRVDENGINLLDLDPDKLFS